VHGDDGRSERSKLFEQGGRAEIARVQDQIGVSQPLDAAIRQPAPRLWQVRVGDDCQQHRVGR
jgi:hypothetical protein